MLIVDPRGELPIPGTPFRDLPMLDESSDSDLDSENSDDEVLVAPPSLLERPTPTQTHGGETRERHADSAPEPRQKNQRDHVNVRVYVVHGGAFSTYEAMWEGVPMVGIPLWEDQMDNMVRVEAQGAGLKLDISGLKSETLSRAICRVMTEPGFRENAQRVSKILRDLQNADRPADNVARWILHVTRFGGDHLRPAVMDLNYVQRNLLDVYLFIGLGLASVIMINASVCYFCCRSLCRIGRGDHFKKE
ncbi:UDP-glucuronosyltransferase 2B31-like [Acanthaster planci]|uniref:UDP-glucuronosyltransferase 2B31-like n=1 Tax=Acanthaster planci TaxID=133434 RepID=A0A8B7Z8X0_ACAPL|nr:UDP-glucuronosyltransferase 2B31-like [Acanthaster planci]